MDNGQRIGKLITILEAEQGIGRIPLHVNEILREHIPVALILHKNDDPVVTYYLQHSVNLFFNIGTNVVLNGGLIDAILELFYGPLFGE